MMETGGLVVLFAWLIFLALLALLAAFVLREHPDVIDEAGRSADGSLDASGRRRSRPS